jgi:hypothetical protein
VTRRSEYRATRHALCERTGDCVTCGRPRGANGTMRDCRACADKHARRAKDRRRAEKNGEGNLR